MFRVFEDPSLWHPAVKPQPCHCRDLAQDGRLCELHKPNGRRYGIIPTLEGNMEISDGDWLIKGVKGEFYPCKPDIFESTYEPVSEPPSSNETRD